MISGLEPRQVDITNKAHLMGVISEIESDQNKKRRKASWKAFQALNGNQKEYVVDRLKELYPETWYKFRIGDINIPKKVISKKSKVYKQVPIRSLENEKEIEALQDIYGRFHFHRQLKEFDRIINSEKYAALWLTWQNPEDIDEEEGRYVLHALWPFEFDVIRDDVSGEPLIFILNYPDIEVTENAGNSDGREQTISESQSDTSSQSRIYSIWDKNRFIKIKVKFANAKADISFMQEPVDHNLGRLPVSFLSFDNSVDYPIPNNLTDQSIEWNISLSDLKTAAATQGHGQLVIKHPSGQKPKKVHMGMHTAITLPQDKKSAEAGIQTTAEYISASPDLAGQLEVLKFDLINILDGQGIQAKSSIEGGVDGVTSGFDRLLKEADVQDIIEDHANMYSNTIEKELYLILKAYEDAMNKNTFRSEDIQVTFQKPKVMISDSEILTNIKMRDELGLLLEHEKHMIIDPNLSEEEARERVEEIKAEKEESMKRMQEMIGEEEGGEDAEEDGLQKEEDEEKEE